MKRRKSKNRIFFLIQDPQIKRFVFLAAILSILVFSFFFLLLVFPLLQGEGNDLFIFEIKNFLSSNFWAPFVFFLLWGLVVIRLSWIISVKKITEPFNRFQNHMKELSLNKEKKVFIHRHYDGHMKDIAKSFNQMLDALFLELDEKNAEIKRLKDERDV